MPDLSDINSSPKKYLTVFEKKAMNNLLMAFLVSSFAAKPEGGFSTYQEMPISAAHNCFIFSKC